MIWSGCCGRLPPMADRDVGGSPVPPDRTAATEGDDPDAIRADPACGGIADRRYQPGMKILQAFHRIHQPLPRHVATGAPQRLEKDLRGGHRLTLRRPVIARQSIS